MSELAPEEQPTQPSQPVGALSLEALDQALRQVTLTASSDPNWLVVHARAVALFQLIEERRRHWYWRAYYWARYAPVALSNWWLAHMSLPVVEWWYGLQCALGHHRWMRLPSSRPGVAPETRCVHCWTVKGSD